MKTLSTLSLFTLIATTALAQICTPNSSALYFDGTSAYVDQFTNNNLAITGPITVEAWVNSAAWGVTSAQNSIVCKHGWSAGTQGYVLRAGGAGKLSFNIAAVDTNGVPTPSGWLEVISPDNSMQLNTWYHVAGTYDGNELKCYINGVVSGDTLFKGSIAASTYSLKIGRIADNQFPARYWNGMIDEVRIWNRALGQAELQTNMYHHLDPISSIGLVSYWRFNENTGSTAADLGTGGNTGTLMGATWVTTVPFNDVPDIPTITYNGTDLISSSPTGNQWYFGVTQLTGQTSMNYTPANLGTYTVTVTSLAGCTSTSAPYNLTSLGIHSPEPLLLAELWPNPARDQFTIQHAGSLQKLEISLFAMTGQMVQTQILQSEADGHAIVDTHGISPGVYTVELSSGQDRTFRKLVLD